MSEEAANGDKNPIKRVGRLTYRFSEVQNLSSYLVVVARVAIRPGSGPI